MADPYLTPTQVRERIAVGGGPTLDDPPFTDEWVAEAVQAVREIIEDECGVAFTPTTTVETVPAPGCRDRLVLLKWPKVRSVTSVTVDGDALTVDDWWSSNLEAGIINLRSSFAYDAEIVFTYVHGFDINDNEGPWATVKRMTAAHVERQAQMARSSNTRDVRVQGLESGANTVYVLPKPGTWQVTGFSDFDADLARLPHFRGPGIA